MPPCSDRLTFGCAGWSRTKHHDVAVPNGNTVEPTSADSRGGALTVDFATGSTLVAGKARIVVHLAILRYESEGKSREKIAASARTQRWCASSFRLMMASVSTGAACTSVADSTDRRRKPFVAMASKSGKRTCRPQFLGVLALQR
jgi:hypothetical protein